MTPPDAKTPAQSLSKQSSSKQSASNSLRSSALGRSIRVKAPGKINASFQVGPLREDGYHSVNSIYLAVSLYEEVTVTAVAEEGISVSIKRAGDAFDLAKAGHWPSIPVDESNLAVKAARLMMDVSEQTTGLKIEILKRVPVAGGMGGGSADAAATLVACDALWGAGLSRDELAHLAAELGADVPFSLFGGAALGRGTGDELSPILAPHSLHWALVKSDFGLSTPTVFSALDRMRAARGQVPEEPGEVDRKILQALRSGDPMALAPMMHNDLQEAATSLAPPLLDILEVGTEFGALSSIVSGSGPTVALLAQDEDHAMDLAERLTDTGYQATAVHSPVHGAKIVADVSR